MTPDGDLLNQKIASEPDARRPAVCGCRDLIGMRRADWDQWYVAWAVGAMLHRACDGHQGILTRAERPLGSFRTIAGVPVYTRPRTFAG